LKTDKLKEMACPTRWCSGSPKQPAPADLCVGRETMKKRITIISERVGK